MKPAASGAVSGCAVWVLVFLALVSCLLPVAVAAGGITSTLSSGFVARTLEPYLCPDGSTADIITYWTTTRDEYGHPVPTTAYEMQCLDSEGSVVRAPSPDYGFIWTGILAAVGLVLSLVLAFVLAAPAGMLVARLIARRKSA